MKTTKSVTPSITPEDLVSAAELAQKLGFTPKTVRAWMVRASDPLPHYRLGGRVRVSLAEARAWVARRSGRAE